MNTLLVTVALSTGAFSPPAVFMDHSFNPPVTSQIVRMLSETQRKAYPLLLVGENDRIWRDFINDGWYTDKSLKLTKHTFGIIFHYSPLPLEQDTLRIFVVDLLHNLRPDGFLIVPTPQVEQSNHLFRSLNLEQLPIYFIYDNTSFRIWKKRLTSKSA